MVRKAAVMAEGKPPVLPDEATQAKQAIAADPNVSAWVSANAGSGKTYVLATRVIRLLLDGVDPSKLLCLTFTKTAAAEMKSRVFDRLAAWVSLDDRALADQLKTLTGKTPGKDKLRFARTLFAASLEAPGGLKIQTIHAFCEALLHRFPLEANVAGHFDLLDDFGAETLMAEAKRYVLTGPKRAPELAGAVDQILSERGEAAFADLIEAIIKKRRELGGFTLLSKDGSEFRRRYIEAFGLDPSVTRNALLEDAWPIEWFNEKNLALIEAHEAGEKRATIRVMVQSIREAGQIEEPEARLSALAKQFLKGNPEKGLAPRTQHIFPDNIVLAIPDYQPAHGAAARKLLDIFDALNKLEDAEQTAQMLIIAKALIGRYEYLKRVRSYLDFDDLIARTATMLKRAGTGAWVRYKLDQGIDHILVDEAQDTSPLQWEVVRTFADEFFDGETARTANRTVFAVGDEKQSIYSFQGADPAGFSAARAHFNLKVDGATKPFEPIALDRSFRSTKNVLAAVDKVFARAENASGLTQAGTYQDHTALRTDSGGQVVLWDVHISEPEPELPENWAEPIDAPARGAKTLADRIAQQIHDWLSGKEPMPVQGRTVTAGDILVLVRKRGAFVGELSRALKTRSVPVAGADRLILTNHIATMDLLALGKCLLNRFDELSLVSVLKSPLFGFDDDDLMALCIERGDKTLWQQMSASSDVRIADAIETLTQFGHLAQSRSAFDFYAHVLSGHGGREKLIARLNPETSDILDEFMALAEAFERDHPGDLHLFIDHVERQSPEIKREMEQGGNMVRVMTVHGAKGLEAPLVFLVDDCTAPHNAAQMEKIVTVPSELLSNRTNAGLPVWNRGKPRSSIMDAMAQRARIADEEEYRRLLYVGMTRAADALFVVGHTTSSKPPNPGDQRWHQMVFDSLVDDCARQETDHGTVYLFRPPTGDKTIDIATPRPDERTGLTIAHDRLDAIAEKAPVEPPPKRPLIPSGATGFAIETTRPTAEDGEARPRSLMAGDNASVGSSTTAVRGSALHTLLQMLPNIEIAERDTLARAWLSQNGFGTEEQGRMIAEVFQVLGDPAYAFLFTPNSRSEVQIMGTLTVKGEERGVSGVIDRIADNGDEVVVVDYKTGQPHQDKIPQVSVYQLALYGALVEKLYPARYVRTLLLYTRGPLIREVSRQDREKALAVLAKD
ncbi:MAG: double-strand break repair helicase AddA [Pseudomonadota bacterium]